jgi:hypothetical protein
MMVLIPSMRVVKYNARTIVVNSLISGDEMKVGDRVKVVSCKSDFFSNIIGTEGVITEVISNNDFVEFDFVIETDEGEQYLVFEEELELI